MIKIINDTRQCTKRHGERKSYFECVCVFVCLCVCGCVFVCVFVCVCVLINPVSDQTPSLHDRSQTHREMISEIPPPINAFDPHTHRPIHHLTLTPPHTHTRTHTHTDTFCCLECVAMKSHCESKQYFMICSCAVMNTFAIFDICLLFATRHFIMHLN